jgi:preprotein translocase subunit SecG
LLVLILVSNVAINKGVQNVDSKALDVDTSAKPLEQTQPVQKPLPNSTTTEPTK